MSAYSSIQCERCGEDFAVANVAISAWGRPVEGGANLCGQCLRFWQIVGVVEKGTRSSSPIRRFAKAPSAPKGRKRKVSA